MPRLQGQVAIVTGGGSGIGRAAAKMFAAEGAQVVVTGRQRQPLDAVVREIEEDGGCAAARACDVAKPVEAQALARWTLERLGRVDILVNNAGHSSKARSVRWVTLGEWEAVVGVNLTGVFVLTQAVLPGMIERGTGTVITVASLAALKSTLVGGAPYGAAKAGARNLMNHIHNTLRDRGIRATTILPAEVDTPILDNRPKPPDAQARATMMQAEDVAAAILLAATLPPRTVIEEIVMSPTRQRDMTAELAVAAMMGAPAGAR